MTVAVRVHSKKFPLSSPTFFYTDELASSCTPSMKMTKYLRYMLGLLNALVARCRKMQMTVLNICAAKVRMKKVLAQN
jgi:hypothetical protein